MPQESEIRVGLAALACVWLGASPLRPTTIAVDCSTGGTIGRALSTAKPGDTVLVSGTCRESVFIRPEIVGNTIVSNNGPGVAIDRGSEADVVANTINGNRGDGIVATHNSGVNLQSPGSPRGDGPNRTDPALKNRGVGVRCSVGGYVDGPLGSLTGMLGAKQFDNTCIDRLTQE